MSIFRVERSASEAYISLPTHGALNAFGFVLCVHLGWWIDQRAQGNSPTIA